LPATGKKEIEYKDLTKTCFDILGAGSLNDIVALLYSRDFDEISGDNQRLEVLKKCYICAQNNTNSNYTTSDDDKKRLDEAYQKMEEFLGVFDVSYSS